MRPSCLIFFQDQRVTAGKTSFNDKGIQAQATYKLGDKFKVTGGLRYTWDSEDPMG